MRCISKDITKALSNGVQLNELHAICFLWTHVFYVLIFPFLRLFCYMCVARQKRRQSPTDGIDGATSVAQTSGGGGTSSDMPWREKVAFPIQRKPLIYYTDQSSSGKYS